MERDERNESHREVHRYVPGDVGSERTDGGSDVQDELFRILEETEELIHDRQDEVEEEGGDDECTADVGFPARIEDDAVSHSPQAARRESLIGEVTREVCRDIEDLSLFATGTEDSENDIASADPPREAAELPEESAVCPGPAAIEPLPDSLAGDVPPDLPPDLPPDSPDTLDAPPELSTAIEEDETELIGGMVGGSPDEELPHVLGALEPSREESAAEADDTPLGAAAASAEDESPAPAAPDGKGAELDAAAGPVSPQSDGVDIASLMGMLQETCNEIRSVTRDIRDQMEELPSRMAPIVAEELSLVSYQKHFQAINVSLAGLNQAFGAIKSQDFVPALKTALRELWPDLDLAGELRNATSPAHDGAATDGTE